LLTAGPKPNYLRCQTHLLHTGTTFYVIQEHLSGKLQWIKEAVDIVFSNSELGALAEVKQINNNGKYKVGNIASGSSRHRVSKTIYSNIVCFKAKYFEAVYQNKFEIL